MLLSLRNLCHRPAIPLGRLGYETPPASRLRSERFASFLADCNRKTLDTRWHDALLTVRKLLRKALVLGAVITLVWVAIESAQAVGMF
ncbi:MAG: hypothetical protein HZA31_08810 [Opitutae bacterium]|nr:hypothetical protein [Opitutae bacterium]